MLPLKHIKNERIRNLVRGAFTQARGGTITQNSKALTSTLNSIQKLANPTEVRQSYEVMASHPEGVNFLPPPFPPTPHRPGGTTLLSPAPLMAEIAKQIGSVGSDWFRAVQFVEDSADLNKAVLSQKWKTVEVLLPKFASDHGASLYLLAKAVSIEEMEPSPDVAALCNLILDQWLKPSPTVVAVAIRDSTSSSYKYIEVRRRFLSYVKNGYVSTKNSAVLEYIFNGPAKDPRQLSLQIQALGQYSALDSISAILGSMDNGLKLTGPVYDELASLYDLWKRLSEGVDITKVYKLLPATVEFKDYNFIQHLFAWREHPKVSSHQRILQSALGNRINGYYGLQPNKKFISTKTKSGNQASGSNLETVNIDDDFMRVGGESTFMNTIVLIEGYFDRENSYFLNTEPLSALLNRTLDLSYLLSPEEIDSLINIDDNLSRKKINQYLVAAVAEDAEKTDASSFRLRKRLESLARAEYESDLIAFLLDMHEKAPRVADHLFEASSELFLSQLFRILEKPNDVTEARIAMLEWKSQAYPDLDGSIEKMAKALKTSIRLQHLRQERNEQRIYVDPEKFTFYLREKIVPELEKSSQIAQSRLNTQNFLALSNPVKVIENPGLGFSNLLQIAFQTFYKDPRFGLISYVGRRIRHGTLSGTLLTEVNEAVKTYRARYPSLDTSVYEHIDTWLRNYGIMVEKIRDEYLQIKSDEKPEGLFVPSLSEGKIEASVANYIEELRQVISDGVAEASLPPTIIDIFWRIAEADIQNVRSTIGELKGQHLFLLPKKVPIGCEGSLRSLAVKINSIVDSKFTLLDEWLRRPQTTSVRASIRLLCEFAIEDVKKRFASFKPNVSITGFVEAAIIGDTIQDLLDVLEIIFGNVAEHGRKTGCLEIDVVTREVIDRHAVWVITIKSQLKEGDTKESVEKSLARAMEKSGEEEAHLVEGNSGLRKVALILEDKNFKGSVNPTVSENHFEVQINLRILNA